MGFTEMVLLCANGDECSVHAAGMWVCFTALSSSCRGSKRHVGAI